MLTRGTRCLLLTAIGVAAWLAAPTTPLAAAPQAGGRLHIDPSGPGFVYYWDLGGGPRHAGLCPTACRFSVDDGRVVHLEGLPGSSLAAATRPWATNYMVWAFVPCGGDYGDATCDLSTSPPQRVEMVANSGLAVPFVRRPTLSVTVVGEGSVRDANDGPQHYVVYDPATHGVAERAHSPEPRIMCPEKRCRRLWDNSFAPGTTELLAEPKSGQELERWEGCDRPIGDICDMLLARHVQRDSFDDMDVTAVFKPMSPCPEPHPLPDLGAREADAAPVCDIKAVYAGSWDETGFDVAGSIEDTFSISFQYAETEVVNAAIAGDPIVSKSLSITNGSESFTASNAPEDDCTATLSAATGPGQIYFRLFDDIEGQVTVSPYLPGPTDITTSGGGSGVCGASLQDDGDFSAQWTEAINPTLTFPASQGTGMMGYPVTYNGSVVSGGETETDIVTSTDDLTVTVPT